VVCKNSVTVLFPEHGTDRPADAGIGRGLFPQITR
jgi:hypothetical protein